MASALIERENVMPVIAKFYGIVIRMLCSRPLGARLHAFYGDTELVVGLFPLRIVQGDAPDRVREMVLRWAGLHQMELIAVWNRLAAGRGAQQVAPLV